MLSIILRQIESGRIYCPRPAQKQIKTILMNNFNKNSCNIGAILQRSGDLKGWQEK
jgi:hypothetical protein